AVARCRRCRLLPAILLGLWAAVSNRHQPLAAVGMSPPTTPYSLPHRAVIWDVDGTLVESTSLGLRGTNAVLKKNGHPEITEAEYKDGTRFPTGERFGFHISGNPKDPAAPRLGKEFDDHYVQLVS
ncbi:unnamed protein product, partial [Polarella glacialis]